MLLLQQFLVSGTSLSFPAFNPPKIPTCSLLLEEMPLKMQYSRLKPSCAKGGLFTKELELTTEEDIERGDGQENNSRISGIRVPRKKHIAVSKAELLDAIMSMFESQAEMDQFRLLSSCLDSILHAEHKSILEEMRVEYDLTHSYGNDTSHEGSINSEQKDFPNGKNSSMNKFWIKGVEPDWKGRTEVLESISSSPAQNLNNVWGSRTRNSERNAAEESRIAVATRFQRAFVHLLYNAQFEELSARDLMLTSALNTDYLLTLPIYVDWKKASESNAIIFRRGYGSERQKGILLVEKLDYLQSKLLQGLFGILSKPLGKFGILLAETCKSIKQWEETQVWTKGFNVWLEKLNLFDQTYASDECISDSMLGVDSMSNEDLPIWLAAQRAVTRYEGILSSIGPRGRLLRRLFTWIGLIPSHPRKEFNLDLQITASEPYLRPIFLPRISLGDLWEPATKERCGNDLWKMLTAAISILLSASTLQEPAFKELILLYTEELNEEENGDKTEIPSLKLKIYERIPIPDLPVIFPHKKLSFRILDTVRLDVASILGLLAYIINYKFEDILSSPSAIMLDVIAISALIIYITRVALGYKQTWDRYELLVNRTLYEKTVASGFGSVHFLLDASEQQQYKEAILAYAILLKTENGQIICPESVGDQCERFMYNMFQEKVEMPIEKAIDTLLRVGLVTLKATAGKVGLQGIPCPLAYENLKQRWNSLIH